MRRGINNVVSVIHAFIRLMFLKIFHWKGLKFFLIERISPNVVLEMNKGAKCELGKKIRIHSGCKIKVRDGGHLIVGDNVKVNYNCIFGCHEKIEIQDGVEFGPNVLIYDHDHDFRAEGGLKEGKYKSAPVFVGKNCWIGAGSIILRGTHIGDDCIVGAGSVIKGKYENGSVIIQKRETFIQGGNI